MCLACAGELLELHNEEPLPLAQLPAAVRAGLSAAGYADAECTLDKGGGLTASGRADVSLIASLGALPLVPSSSSHEGSAGGAGAGGGPRAGAAGAIGPRAGVIAPDATITLGKGASVRLGAEPCSLAALPQTLTRRLGALGYEGVRCTMAGEEQSAARARTRTNHAHATRRSQRAFGAQCTTTAQAAAHRVGVCCRFRVAPRDRPRAGDAQRGDLEPHAVAADAAAHRRLRRAARGAARRRRVVRRLLERRGGRDRHAPEPRTTLLTSPGIRCSVHRR